MILPVIVLAIAAGNQTENPSLLSNDLQVRLKAEARAVREYEQTIKDAIKVLYRQEFPLGRVD